MRIKSNYSNSCYAIAGFFRYISNIKYFRIAFAIFYKKKLKVQMQNKIL